MREALEIDDAMPMTGEQTGGNSLVGTYTPRGPWRNLRGQSTGRLGLMTPQIMVRKSGKNRLMPVNHCTGVGMRGPL